MNTLKHTWPASQKPERVVILGAAGFIGKALVRLLEKEHFNILALGRPELDLLAKDAARKLSTLLRPTDALVFLSTLTPDRGRGIDAFVKNIQMAETVCYAIANTPLSHVVYLSADTVYPLHRGLISEESPTDPENLHGAMHLAREYMVKATTTAPVALLRSTLIYGLEDTHNSYGPNRMRRMALKEGKISLFGNGEEYRDHIFIDDLITLIVLTLLHRSVGILNLVTGQSITYLELAKKIAALFNQQVEVLYTERSNPITHRHFDASAIYKTFPSFCFTPIDNNLKTIHEEELRSSVCSYR
ncbi:MAG: NAD(P)-dependent oxidoreductase [Simkania sp.]|nr:NAD(P)-dependent oxidoreductase [Simkania sp.]